MKNVISKILHTWYIYLLAIISVVAIVLISTNSINRPINEETMSIFVASCQSSNGKLYNKLLNEKPDYLRQIKINSAVYFGNDYDYLYSTFGKTECDLVIIPESKIADEAVKYYYTPLNEEYMNSKLGEVGYYTPKDMDKPFGVLIRSTGEEGNNLITYSTEGHDENYYAFLNRKSFHAGENNKVEHDTSIKFIDIIMNNK